MVVFTFFYLFTYTKILQLDFTECFNSANIFPLPKIRVEDSTGLF